VVLPFATEFLAYKGDLATSWGSHEGSTMLTYVAVPGMSATTVVPLKPVFDSAPDADFTRNDLRGSLYFLSSGLKRRFMFQGPTPSLESSAQWKALVSVATVNIDAVLLRFPQGAELLESDSSKRIPTSSRDTASGRMKVFAHANAPVASLKPLDVTYLVPPTQQQRQITDYGLKLFGVLLVPLVGWIVLTSDKVKAKKTRAIAICSGVAVEVLILGGLLWWAFKVQSVEGLGALLEIGVVVVGVVLTIVTVRIKGEP
jgi:hypothetical protein